MSGIQIATQAIQNAGAFYGQAMIEAGRAIGEGVLKGATVRAQRDLESEEAKRKAEQAQIQGEILATVGDPGASEQAEYRLVEDPQFIGLLKDPNDPSGSTMLADDKARQTAFQFFRQKGWNEDDSAHGVNELFRPRTASYIDDKTFGTQVNSYLAAGGNPNELQSQLSMRGLTGHVGKQSVLEIRSKDAEDFWKSSPKYAQQVEESQAKGQLAKDTNAELQGILRETRMVMTPMGVPVPVPGVPKGAVTIRPVDLVPEAASTLKEMGKLGGLDQETILDALGTAGVAQTVQVIGKPSYEAALENLQDVRRGSAAMSEKEARAELANRGVFQDEHDLRRWARDTVKPILDTVSKTAYFSHGQRLPNSLEVSAQAEAGRLLGRARTGGLPTAMPASVVQSIDLRASFPGQRDLQGLKLYAGADGKVHVKGSTTGFGVSGAEAERLTTAAAGITDNQRLFDELVILQASGTNARYAGAELGAIKQQLVARGEWDELVQLVTGQSGATPAPAPAPTGGTAQGTPPSETIVTPPVGETPQQRLQRAMNAQRRANK